MCSKLLRWILRDYCIFKKKREIAGTGWRHKGYFCLCSSNSVSILDCILGSGMLHLGLLKHLFLL